MRSMFSVLCLALATTVSAQAKPEANSVAIYPLNAGGGVNVYQFAGANSSLQASVGMRIAQAFTNTSLWQVSNRATDARLLAELDRSADSRNFKSPIIVKDNATVNARYVMTGLIDQAESIQGRDDKGCPTYKIVLHFTTELADVQTALVVSSESFIAGWPSLNPQTARDVAKLKGTEKGTEVASKIGGRMMGALRGDKNQSASPSTTCSDSPAKALEYALIDVTNQVESWATSTAAKRAGHQ